MTAQGFLSWQKLLFGMEEAISICWLTTTIEIHTYYRGEPYPPLDKGG